MTEAEIEAKVIQIVADQMGVDKAEVSRDTSFANDLNADSLDTVELVMEFEASACVVIQSSKPCFPGSLTDHFSGDIPGSFLSHRSPRCHFPSWTVGRVEWESNLVTFGEGVSAGRRICG